MSDPRVQRLAQILVDYSMKVTRNDVVQIDFSGTRALPLVEAIYRRCLQKGAVAEYVSGHESLTRAFFEEAGTRQLDDLPRHRLAAMRRATCYVGIGADEDPRFLARVPTGKVVRRQRTLKPVVDRRVNHTRWVVTRYPTQGFARAAHMSLRSLEELFFKSCLLDWPLFSKRLTRLQQIVGRARDVRITAPDTDLRFSLKGMPAVKCEGLRNMPDGEVFTAPVRGSVEGRITYNVPSLYHGREFNGVRFVFRKGRIVEASCRTGAAADLKRILDSDPGARYIGEFSFGLNPHIRRPVRNILFDEKITGSFHFTPGQAYGETDNGNRSSVHWDLVKDLRPGGAVYFDGRLIQEDGLFVPKELQPLNPR
ncbi:MAG: aminopeptidase [Deltaproteobacteria bacterium]